MEGKGFLTLDPRKVCAMFNFFPDTTSRRTIFVVGSGRASSGSSIILLFFQGYQLRLSSTIIEDIAAMCEAGQASMAYFYFDDNKQHIHDVIPALISQLSARSQAHHDILSRLYEEHDNGKTRPSDLDLIFCLKQILFSFPT